MGKNINTCFFKLLNTVSQFDRALREYYGWRIITTVLSLLIIPHTGLCKDSNNESTELPRIDFIQMKEVQPQEIDQATIWYDDFNSQEKEYSLKHGNLDSLINYGPKGKSLMCQYLKGEMPGNGGVKLFFGDCPWGVKARRGESFDEIYFRFYVKHQKGWIPGRSQKMARATSIVALNDWRQAMIAHIWCPTWIKPGALSLDPVSLVDGKKVKSNGYNDFDNFIFLRKGYASKFEVGSAEESGRWICVEVKVKLNTIGKKDGSNHLWIDGNLELELDNLDFRGSYAKHGINAVFLESYCAFGSPATQTRWYDNFIISEKPIGPVVASRNPTIYKTKYYGPDKQLYWEMELSADNEGKDVVWCSNLMSECDSTSVCTEKGYFSGSLVGKSALKSSSRYYCRVRQRGGSSTWSEWSGWHQPFITSLK